MFFFIAKVRKFPEICKILRSFKSKESGNMGIFRKRKGTIPRFQDSIDKRIIRQEKKEISV